MTDALPKELVAAAAEGRVVLFLGAGASVGAIDVGGNGIPLASSLAEAIVKDFLGPDYIGLDFRSAYDLACTVRDVRTIQKYLYEILNQFEPAPFHRLISELPWAGLVTTNYDLVIERAYDNKNAVQHIVPFRKDGEAATSRLDGRSLIYVKLHGCITLHADVKPPMVASTEQLITFREGRIGQIDTFLEWSKNKTVVFAGYSFADPNIRTIFDEIIKDGTNRPRHYIVAPRFLPAERQYWSDRRVDVVPLTFESFIRGLHQAIPAPKRALGARTFGTAAPTSLTRFITTPDARESDELRAYLAGPLVHLGPELKVDTADPNKFYKGFDLGWAPILQELDVRLPIVDDVLLEEIVKAPPPTPTQNIVLIKGHAGSGKTTVLRRLAVEAAQRYGRLSFFCTRGNILSPEVFREVFLLSNMPVYLFVDDISTQRSASLRLLEIAQEMRQTIKIIATETYSNWNVQCDDLAPFVATDYEMRYLSEAGIVSLISKLEEHGSLGYLQALPQERRLTELREVHGRQLLVALLEATHGFPLVDIIRHEYDGIPDDDAKRLYLDICSLHRFGPPVRAGLISRIHDMTFEQFEKRFFLPLEKIVALRVDPKSGDYVYEARHAEIASVLYDVVLRDPEERFDNIVRILSKLNPAFSYDLEVLGKIIRAENVEAVVPDENRARQIYDVALDHMGERSVIFHQRGIYEMHRANNLGRLRVAEEWFERALAIEPGSGSFRHSLAELDLKRSRVAEDSLERRSWRDSARTRASELTLRGSSPYPYHTLMKASIDEVKEALADVERVATDSAVQRLGSSIQLAEDTLKRGLGRFPNDPRLLNEEGELSASLAQAGRAESAFQKAFNANPRSTLVARRLARVKRAKGEIQDAIEALRKSLSFNPASQVLHYDLAMSLMESSPDADRVRKDDILYHLRRSFTPTDHNYQAQFWYARQLVLCGEPTQARGIFKTLSDARLPMSEKNELRGIVAESNGEPRTFIGTVTNVRTGFGFLHNDELNVDVYFRIGDVPDRLMPTVGMQLQFELGFTLKGPTALSPRRPA